MGEKYYLFNYVDIIRRIQSHNSNFICILFFYTIGNCYYGTELEISQSYQISIEYVP